jgi:hypothetical protein
MHDDSLRELVLLRGRGGVLICGVEATISKAYLDLVHES